MSYLHLVDGGITDNLGLLSVYEMSEYLRYNDNEELKNLYTTTSTRALLSSFRLMHRRRQDGIGESR
ncbi:hypothetical protein O9992_18650 [Vibrio lentus]|nr:hypothetical protein [Vibrio lentus]